MNVKHIPGIFFIGNADVHVLAQPAHDFSRFLFAPQLLTVIQVTGNNYLRRFGVDTSGIVRGGERVGIYFLEKGASQRPSKVIYDRADSAICKASKEDFDWKQILDGADWFHFTGITPALNDTVSDICLDACKAAHEMGMTGSLVTNAASNP